LKFRTVLNKEVEKHYHNWLSISRKYTRDDCRAADLLHVTIEVILNGARSADLAASGELDNYVRACIYHNYVRPDSPYHRIYTRPDSPGHGLPDLPDQPAMDQPGGPPDLNGTLSDIDATIYRLLMAGIRPVEISRQTEIPISYIYNRINRIRAYVQSSKEDPRREVVSVCSL
jgi:hypothetical protein